MDAHQKYRILRYVLAVAVPLGYVVVMAVLLASVYPGIRDSLTTWILEGVILGNEWRFDVVTCSVLIALVVSVRVGVRHVRATFPKVSVVGRILSRQESDR